jgi:CheY-like chemotaxis protein
VKKKNKIMLIDDNPGDAILLREALKMANLGVDFEAFQSGKEALKQLEERYDN